MSYNINIFKSGIFNTEDGYHRFYSAEYIVGNEGYKLLTALGYVL